MADFKRSQAGYRYVRKHRLNRLALADITFFIAQRTRKGKVIHFISALLLELMQTSAHGVKDMLDAADVAEMMDMDDEAGGQKSDTKLVCPSAHSVLSSPNLTCNPTEHYRPCSLHRGYQPVCEIHSPIHVEQVSCHAKRS